jgi:hypothetical protein
MSWLLGFYIDSATFIICAVSSLDLIVILCIESYALKILWRNNGEKYKTITVVPLTCLQLHTSTEMQFITLVWIYCRDNRVFRETHYSFDVWHIRNFLGYRSIWYMNESSLLWRVCVHVVLMWTSWTCCKQTMKLSTVMQGVTCDLFSNSFNFHLATPEQYADWCSTHNFWCSLKEIIACLVNMVARTIHIWNTLEIDSTGHSYQTRHAGCPRWHLIYVDVNHLAGKLFPHVLLPEWPHFAITAGTAGLLWYPPQRLVQ